MKKKKPIELTSASSQVRDWPLHPEAHTSYELVSFETTGFEPQSYPTKEDDHAKRKQ